MKLISLLPADTYTVINKTILTEVDKNNLISLYEPIIGPIPMSLYLTLWRDLDKLELMSIGYTHHHLMTIMKSDLESIKKARETLEAVGLIRTYIKVGEVNTYVYELYSPLNANEFFNNPIFNIVLYNNIGKNEYDMLKVEYQKINFDIKEYEEITRPMNLTFKSGSNVDTIDAREKKTLGLNIVDQIDFDLLISSLPKGLINDRTFNKKIKELIVNLSFIYNLDTLKMAELLRMVINEKGMIDKEELRKSARKYYQFNNNGNLPTLVYRTQPDYLKNPSGGTSKKDKIIYVFENTSPYDFLQSKYKGSNPTSRDLKLLETLLIDVGLKPAVVNVLVDYVLKKNNNKLNQAFIETIAGQWKRSGVETALEAMQLAEKEHKKYNKKISSTTNKKINEAEPVWFNENILKESISQEEEDELKELLKEFR
ncbi:MAG: replication initiation and membrane attachment family protein [Bacilli bacterium]